MRIGLIGAGTIGTELIRQARNRGYDVGPVVTTSGVYDISRLGSWEGELSRHLHENPEYKVTGSDDYKAPLNDVQAVCLAVPSSHNEIAYRYMTELFEAGIPVVTCEKGALSMHFTDLLEPIKEGSLGYRASVGGGTSMLKYMQERVRSGFDGKVYVVVNGTLNFWLSGVADGRSSGQMITEAKTLKYAEPGAVNALEVINGEACGDVPKKSTILFNFFLYSLGKTDDFLSNDSVQSKTQQIDSEMLREIIRKAEERRYIVSIRRPDGGEEDIIGGYSLVFGEWELKGGFRNINNDPLYKQFLPKGVDNAILIAEGPDEIGGVYKLSGPGAGPIPTTLAMLRDLDDMSKAGVFKF